MFKLKTSVLVLGQYEPRRLIQIAKLAEECQYDVFWYADERFFREVYSGLTLAATNTQRIGLGTCVTDPYTRHPALTAMAIATLDEISEGRAVLGAGAGVSGFAPLGVKRDKPVVALREMIDVVQGLLSGGEVNYRGQLVRFEGGQLDFKPVRPRVPVYIASNGELGLALAGQIANGAIMQGAIADRTIDWMIANVGRGAKKAGRELSEIDLVARVNLCIAQDARAAKAVMKPGLARSLIATQPDFPTFKVAGLEVTAEMRERAKTIGYTYDPDKLAPVAELLPDEYVDALTLAGDPDQVAASVLRMARRGITHVEIFPITLDGCVEQTMEVFARQVMPRVQELDRAARQETTTGGDQ
jgi:5,10-methylenetetrahydromethanopterin reductase